jgi:hypothetical protein
MRDFNETAQAQYLLFASAREAPISESLVAFGTHVTGYRGYLLASGYVLAGLGDETSAITEGGHHIGAENLVPLSDPTLAECGLVLLKSQDKCDRVSLSTALAALLVRLGLLAQSLDMAHRHLLHRSSFGLKVTRHQLVRATFSRANGLVEQIIEECGLIGVEHLSIIPDNLVRGCIDKHHRAVSSASAQVAKLMGGHGYLSGGNNYLDYVSSIIGSVYASSLTEGLETCRDIPPGRHGLPATQLRNGPTWISSTSTAN